MIAGGVAIVKLRGSKGAASGTATGSGSGSAAGADPARTVLLAGRPDRPLLGVAISADGTQLAVATGHAILRIPRAGGAPVELAAPAYTYDVDLVGPAATMFATFRTSDDGWKTMVFGGTVDDRSHYRSDRDRIAFAPDGTTLAYAEHGRSIYLDRPGVTANDPWVRAASGESVPALAWSPDGTRLAFVRNAPDRDATIEVIALDATTPTIVTRRRLPAGEPRAFGWTDAGHLAYAVNAPTGATIVSVDVDARTETEVGHEPQLVIAGRAGGGALAYLAATPVPVLRTGEVGHDLTTVAGAAPLALAGWTEDGRRVIASTTAAPVAIDASGVASAWPGGAAGDRVETTCVGRVLAVRAEPEGAAIWSLGGNPRRLAGVDHDPAITAVRCADDHAAPCIRTTLRGTTLRVVRWDPDTATDGDEVGRAYDVAGAADVAVSATGAIAIVHGTSDLTIFAAPGAGSGAGSGSGAAPGDRRRLDIPGAALDRIAWAGADLIVTARAYRDQPWATLRVTVPPTADAKPTITVVDASATTSLGVPRVSSFGRLAIARTELDVVLIVRAVQ